MIERNRRNLYLDIVKGIAIFFVVLGHCIQFSGAFQGTDFFNNILFKIIYSVHMPLFIIVSGYLFYYTITRHDVKEIIKSRIETLFIPIVSFSTIDFVMRIITRKTEMTASYLVAEYIINLMCNLWFLWAVIYCSLIVLIVNKLFNDRVWIYIVGFFVTFFVPDVLNLSLYKFVYPFFVGGYFYNKYNCAVLYNKMNKMVLLSVFAIAYIVLLLRYDYNSYIYTSGHCILINGRIQMEQFGIDMFRTLIGIIGSIFLLILIHMIYTRCAIINGISIVGKNSLGIYAISGYIFSYGYVYVSIGINGHLYLTVFLQAMLITLLCTGVSIILRRNNIANWVLFGARK